MKIPNKKGESLIEVIISLFILVMAGMAITTLIILSMQATYAGKQRMIAANLAREGIKTVANIVSTNWLRFPANQPKCWNILDENVANVDGCDANEINSDEHYVLNWVAPDSQVFNNNNSYFKWKLETAQASENAELELKSENKTAMANYCLYPLGVPETRKGLLIQNKSGADCSGFYRQITVEYDGTDPDHEMSMDVVSKVQWLRGSQTKTVKAKATLYNMVY